MSEILVRLAEKMGKPKTYLIGANVFLVLALILLSNLGILPIQGFWDFLFYSGLALIFALYRPGWAFLFFSGTILLENINLAPGMLGFQLRPYQFVGGIVLASLGARFFLKRINFDLPKLGKVDWLVGVFGLAGLVSALGNPGQGASLKQSLVALSFVALYFLVRIFIQNVQDLRRVVPFFLGSLIVTIGYGIWQSFQFMHGKNSFEAMPGRPNATLAEADWLGMSLVLFMAVLYPIIFYVWKTRAENRLTIFEKNQKIELQATNSFLYFLLIASNALLVLTVSRSAWLGWVAVSLTFLWLMLTDLKIDPRKWKGESFWPMVRNIAVAAFLGIGVVLLFRLTSFQLFNRVESTGTGLQKITVSCKQEIALPEKIEIMGDLEKIGCRHINLEEIETEKIAGNFVGETNRPDPNVNIRQTIYQKSWQLIKENPILGIGWGNIGQALGKDARGSDLNSSNIFLEVWLGSGILGIASFLLVWSYIIFRAIRLFRSENEEQKMVALFILLGTVALIVTNLFNAGIFLGFLWVFLGIAVSLLNYET
jgi:hypothetical protein